MSLLDVYGYIDYLADNPYTGKMLKAVIDGLCGNDVKNKPTKKPKFKNDEERKAWERQQLHKMAQEFGFDINNLPKKPKRKIGDISKLLGKEVNNG
jgi:hypothetical protein